MRHHHLERGGGDVIRHRLLRGGVILLPSGGMAERAKGETDRRLDLDQDPGAVAGIEQFGHRRIMRGADVVDMRGLEQRHVGLRPAGGIGAPGERMRLVMVDAAQKDAPPVQMHLPVAHRHLAEPDRHFVFGAVKAQMQGIKLRMVGIP